MKLETLQDRLQVSGFHLEGDALREIGPWMRWSTSFCATFVAAGTLFASPAILWALAATAFAGALLPNHPFDYLYNYGVRRLTKTRPLPRNTAARKFACAMATPWLLATGALFAYGVPVAATVLGIAFFAVAALVSLTHICIPSIIFNFLFGARVDLGYTALP
jgi:hypothetical protein